MVDMKALSEYHTSPEAKKILRRRHASEARFKAFGLLAIGFAVAALGTLVWTIGSNAMKALLEYDAVVTVEFPADAFNPDTMIKEYERPLIEQGIFSEASIIRRETRGRVDDAVKAGFLALFDAVPDAFQTEARELLSNGAVDPLFAEVFFDKTYGSGDRVADFHAVLSDDAQLYFKGGFGSLELIDGRGVMTPVRDGDTVELLDGANDFAAALALVKASLRAQAGRLRRDAARQIAAVAATEAALADASLSDDARAKAEAALKGYAATRDRLVGQAEDLERRADQPGGVEKLTEDLPSFFVFMNGGAIKVTELSNERVRGVEIRALKTDASAEPGAWRVGVLETPESARRLKDVSVVLLEELRDKGAIIAKSNIAFLTSSDSREAELAGVWGGLVGSFWTMLVTFCIAFPIGVMAAIYLEEFAPKNAFTDFVEVNINNLAAIPSIIFGLFGLLLLLSGFEIPIFGGIEIGGWFKEYRSAAFVGGIVLALMSLPTIIIAARASVRAVPPSIRAAAMGLGASKVQTVFHHVLPLAMPGVMTGTIIAMAQALGETAPLLLVGMVGFFPDIADGVADPTTVMPALVYLWSDYPENLFELKTSLAIVVMLCFLIAMNALAVFLRKRFERRW